MVALGAVRFTGVQLGATLLTLAATLLVGGLVVGVPVGLLVARLAWSAVARDLAIDATPTSPVLPLLGAVGAAVALLAVAMVPARTARRLPTADALRSE